jgi:hypothetical protein
MSVFSFLSLAGAWGFGLRIFPQNRVTGWTGGYQEPSYGLSNQGICVFLAIAVVLVTRAQTRIPRWFGRTHSSSLLRLFLTLTIFGAMLIWGWSLYRESQGQDDIAYLFESMNLPCLSIAVAVLNILWSIFRRQPA